MEIVGIIEARMGSSRLPGKSMADLVGKPMLQHIIERVKRSQLINQIVVATTIKEGDREIVDLAKKLKVGFFQGSENDVLSRVLNAAVKYKADVIVELTADCPFVDSSIIDQVINKYLTGNYDYVSNVSERTFPRGLDVQAFSTKTLLNVSDFTRDPIDREHVSLYIYNHPKIFRLGTVIAEPGMRRSYRLTVDEEDDLELTRRIYKFFYRRKRDFSAKDVISLLDRNPQLAKLNSGVKQKPVAGYKRKNLSGVKNRKGYIVGIIGCGRIASLFDDNIEDFFVHSLAGAFTVFPGTNLVAACDTDKKRLTEFGKRWGVKKLYNSYKNMLDEENLDILVIATNNNTHYKIIKKASTYPLKAIFCEKPFTNSLKNARGAVDLCDGENIILSVDHSRRWDTLHHQIKGIISREEIGRISKVVVFYTRGIANSGSHIIDLLRLFLGEPISARVIESSEKKSTADPSFDVNIKFRDAEALMIGFDNTKFNFLEIGIIGESGRINIKKGGKIVKIYKLDPKIGGLKEIKVLEGGLDNMLVRAIANIVGAIEGKEKLLSTGEDGFRAMEVITAIYQSYYKNGGEVVFPLKGSSFIIRSRI